MLLVIDLHGLLKGFRDPRSSRFLEGYIARSGYLQTRRRQSAEFSRLSRNNLSYDKSSIRLWVV